MLAMTVAATDWQMESGAGLSLSETPPLLLNALAQRLPMVDRFPLRALLSPYRLYEVRQVFAKLFVFHGRKMS